MRYGLDNTGLIIGIDVIDESQYASIVDTDVPWNCDLVKPKWDGNSFVEGATDAEIEANKMDTTVEPTSEQLMIAQLTLKVAKLEAKL